MRLIVYTILLVFQQGTECFIGKTWVSALTDQRKKLSFGNNRYAKLLRLFQLGTGRLTGNDTPRLF